MENQSALESPQVSYPMHAAAPGFNWHDNRPSPSADDNEIYVPVPGDEDFLRCDFTISSSFFDDGTIWDLDDEKFFFNRRELDVGDEKNNNNFASDSGFWLFSIYFS